MTTDKIYSSALEIKPHSAWSQAFWDQLMPHKEQISQHPFFNEMAAGTLSLTAFRHALLNFYPLVAHFPAYMGLALSKALHFEQAGVTETRNWLIQNIKVEERHLIWYRDWATGFGVTAQQLDTVEPSAQMDAVNHFLWHVNLKGGLAESLAATNLAIEWATGDWTSRVYQGIKAYQGHPEVEVSKRTLAWLRAHALYDDVHPYEAMELIKRLCHDDEAQQQKAFTAAKTGLDYYALALDECYKIHQKQKVAA